MAFHDVRLPDGVERGAQGGPSFMTTVVTTKSGMEYRNADWARARARWDVGYGIQTLEDLRAVLAFFYARRGRLHSFRFKDWSDYEAVFQPIGTGNGVQNQFQLVYVYDSGGQSYARTITKPVSGTVFGAVNGTPVMTSTNLLTGIITFAVPPANGTAVTATFQFDVPVRFDVDQIPINVQTFAAGSIPSIPVIEVLE